KESQSGQVNGSASRRNDVGPDLVERYDVTGLGSPEGESTGEYDRQCCRDSGVEEFECTLGFQGIDRLLFRYDARRERRRLAPTKAAKARASRPNVEPVSGALAP